METLHEKIQALEKEREKQTTRLFAMMLEIAFIFGIPAAIVVAPAIYFNHKDWLYLLLPIAFISSWIMVIVRYRQMDKKLSGLDAQIKELRKQL